MNRIASYVRVSTGRQREKMTSETQRAGINDYAKTFGIPEPREFRDEGVSSRVPFETRPGSSALMKAARAGQIEKLIVYSLDRLGRDYDKPDTQLAVYHLWKAGVKTIVSLKQGEIHNDKSGRLLLPILCGVAGYERATTLERTDDAKWRIAKTGSAWLGGPAPFGYRIEGRSKDATLAVDEPQARWVRRMFDWAADGWGCRRVAKELNISGVLPPRAARSKPNANRSTNSEWYQEQVKRILTNPLYHGQQLWGKNKIVWDENGAAHLVQRSEEKCVRRSCKAIVSEQLFERVQAVLERTEAAHRAHAKREYLLSGLIRCGCCDKAFTGVASRYSSGERDASGKIKERLYYKCTARFGKDGFHKQRCNSPSLPARDLEAAVWEYVAGFLARPAMAKAELEAKIAAEGKKDRSVADDIRDLEKSLAKFAEGRKVILRQAGRGDATPEEVAAALRQNREDEANLQARLEQLRQMNTDQKKLQLDLDWAGRLLGELHEKLIKGDLTFTKKRQFVEALVDRITVAQGEDGRAQVRVKFRFDRDHERLQRFLESHEEGGHPVSPRRGSKVSVPDNASAFETPFSDSLHDRLAYDHRKFIESIRPNLASMPCHIGDTANR